MLYLVLLERLLMFLLIVYYGTIIIDMLKLKKVYSIKYKFPELLIPFYYWFKLK